MSNETSTDPLRQKMEDQAVRIIREAAELRTYISDALNKGNDVSRVRFNLAVRHMAGEIDSAVFITALVDQAVATLDAIRAYDECE